MFDLLFESRPVRARRMSHSILAFALHGGLIGGAVVLTQRPLDPTASRSYPIDLPIYEPVPTAPVTGPADPVPGRIPAAPAPWARPDITIPSEIDPAVPSGPVTSPGLVLGDIKRLVGEELRGGISGPTRVESREAMLLDSLPTLLRPVAPDFPEVLRAAGIVGQVALEFVVDSSGRALDSSLVVLASDHPAFSAAARAAILASRYRPAFRGGRAIAARVQQVVRFSLH